MVSTSKTKSADSASDEDWAEAMRREAAIRPLDATVKYANDARRRIAARAAKKQAAVLRRKPNPASSKMDGHVR